jgi:hypothetical protein
MDLCQLNLSWKIFSLGLIYKNFICVVNLENLFVAQFIAAEKGGEGMALKIITKAEDMPDGEDNLESHAHTKWKIANKVIQDNC